MTMALFLLVCMIPVQTQRSFNSATRATDTELTAADAFTANIHTGAAVVGCLLVISLEYIQLCVGEQMFSKSRNNLQKMRFASVSLALVFLIGYVAFGYCVTYPQPDPKHQIYYRGQALGFCSEVLALSCLAFDFILISYIKPTASLA